MIRAGRAASVVSAVLTALATTVFIVAMATPLAASPKSLLADAAHGTWTSDFGTIEFRDDGTARFTLKQCGFAPVRPGVVETFTDCEPDEPITGRLRVATDGYHVVLDDDSEYTFAAYVEGDALHVGVGAVARLGADREGVVELGGSERLEVGDGTCTYSSAFTEKPLEKPCRFVEQADRTVLIYKAPNPFEGGKVTKNGLAYLAELRLLVSPELLDRVFVQTAT